MDANECTIVKVTDRIDILWHKESFVNRKQDSGGQSEKRFERIREEQLKQWNKEVYLKIKELYNDNQIILAGPGETKTRLRVYFEPPVNKKVISVVDVGYTCLQGIYEALEKAQKDIHDCEYLEHKKLVNKFTNLLYKEPEFVEYGENIDDSCAEFILVNNKYKDKYKNGILVNDPVVNSFGVCMVRKYKKY